MKLRFKYFALTILVLVQQTAYADSLISPSSTGPDWASGARNSGNQYAFFLDVQKGQLDLCQKYSIGVNKDKALTWNDIAHPTNMGRQGFNVNGCNQWIYGLRILPQDQDNAVTTNCASYVTAGTTTRFDSYYDSMATELAASAPKFMVIRVGWELNDDFPWSIIKCDTPAKIAAYKKAHQKIVTKLRAAFARQNKSFIVSWSFIRESSKLPRPVQEYFPGDDYVDTVGLDYYDHTYPKTRLSNSTDANFTRMATNGTVDKPFGIETWYAFAQKMKKPFSVDEWGINNPSVGDNPTYIRGMYNFFNEHKNDTVHTLSDGVQPALGFENYANYGEHMLGTTKSPKASAEYRRLWGQ